MQEKLSITFSNTALRGKLYVVYYHNVGVFDIMFCIVSVLSSLSEYTYSNYMTNGLPSYL